MPTEDHREAISLDEARRRAGFLAFPVPGDANRLGGIGLEPELFPIITDQSGAPLRRLQLSDPGGGGVIEIVDGLAVADPRIGARVGRLPGPVEFPVEGGGRLTFEPGGQVEHSTAVYPGVGAAVEDVKDVIGRLRVAFGKHQVALAAVGIDVWNDVETVSQQLRAGRYTAQAAYYRQRGPWGAVMMRHTASLQINLDLGPEGVWQERWLVANLASPLLTASFASSPGPDGVVCARARTWQELDPTRAGFPRLLVEGAGNDPRLEWGQAALDADVMLFRLSETRYEPGCLGCNFIGWILDGHPKWGWPTVEDLDYHVTTLFFEVRPRGFLELRAGEALPDRWRAAPVTVSAALCYDDNARAAGIELLEGCRTRLPELWRRAATDGVRDPEIRDLACRLWEIALEGARRLPEEFVGEEDLATTRAFLDHFTARGRTPGDDLTELLEENPARALEWAST
ncbi:MAG: glutamate-cysteine ligase family protein [Thermoanaerobaculales bacterium]